MALAVLAIAVNALPSESAQASDRKLIVCSTTQVADFARQVVGDQWEVRSILAPGQDPHLYQVTPNDARLTSQADLCLDNGWHLEGNDWMRSLARGAGKPIVTCTEGVPPLELDEDGQLVRDPHAWFAPKNAVVYVRNILAAVSQLDPENKRQYEARAELYLSQLQTLNGWIQRQVNLIPAQKRVLVTSHDAFNYFCREYGFRPASPVGWSTGDEIGAGVTPERRRKVVESIRGFGVKAIFVESSVNPKRIEEIASEAGVKIGGQLYSDSMGPPGSAGETYVGMMRENVVTIVEALK
jgi:manganese/iron transport system substrate-binding protein